MRFMSYEFRTYYRGFMVRDHGRAFQDSVEWRISMYEIPRLNGTQSCRIKQLP